MDKAAIASVRKAATPELLSTATCEVPKDAVCKVVNAANCAELKERTCSVESACMDWADSKAKSRSKIANWAVLNAATALVLSETH